MVRQRRMLIVADSDLEREVLGLQLAGDPRVHCQLTFVTTLAEAVEAATGSTFDVTVVGASLPEGCGLELAAALHGANVHTPVVVTTHREPAIDPARVQGTVEFIPACELSAVVLRRTCEHALVRAQMTRELEQARRAEQHASLREHEARLRTVAALTAQARLVEHIDKLRALSSLFSRASSSDEVSRTFSAQRGVFGEHASASVYLLREQTLVLQAHAECSGPAWRQEVSMDTRNVLTDAVRSAELAFASSSQELERPHDTKGHAGGTCCLAVPLRTEGAVLGVVAVRFERGHRPASEDHDFFQLVATLLAQALVRARLHEDAIRRGEIERRLLAIVGHDLRTPLSAAVTAVHLLKHRLGSDILIERLDRNLTNMSRLVGDVMARSEGLQLPEEDDAAPARDLVQLVRDLADESRAAFPEHEIVVCAEGPIEGALNTSRTMQVVSNLTRNAVQYGLKGRPVTIAIRAPDQATVEISVHNEGPSIAPEEVRRLFDPFQRGRHAAGRGSGLGLFIVHELVTMMRGKVWVESGEHGTTFFVSLPRGMDRLNDAAGACA